MIASQELHNSVEEALVLQQQLQQLLEKGGFLLRKWRTNSPEVLNQIPENLREDISVQIMPSCNEFPKTLGIRWDSSQDKFYFSTAHPKF